MERALNQLNRVLELEKEQGYQNKAVVGGIGQFAVYWISRAREEAVDEADLALAEQIGEVLAGYGRLPGAQARAQAIDSLVASAGRRQARAGQTRDDDRTSTKGAREEPARTSAAAPPAVEDSTEESAGEVEDDVDEDAADTDEAGDLDDEEGEEGVTAPEDDVTPELADDDDLAEDETDNEGAADPEGLRQQVVKLKGVGPKIGERLNKLGAETIWDLLYVFPRRYDDYSVLKPINRLAYGEQVTVIGTIWQTKSRRTRTNQTIVESIISDGTGTIQATWFNQPWLVEQLPAGMQIVLSGKIDIFLGRLVFNAPEWEPLELEPLRTRRIVPVYPLTEGLNAGKMREIMQRAVSEWSDRVPDPLPAETRKRLKLMSLSRALTQMHFPDSQMALDRARRRLAFDELYLLQLGFQQQRRQWQSHPGLPLAAGDAALNAFYEQLPFSLTGAQRQVIEEISHDIAQARPMNRLLQGDVGSGKTVVAAAAMVVAAEAGAQSALMAPTEILAEQHYRGLRSLLEPLSISVALLTSSTPAAAREAIYNGLAGGTIQVVIGTHALIQPAVRFDRLGLAVIDEQHRFGVDQRAALRDKGPEVDSERLSPHLLVMSATPIPRTLALTLFGDLDLSILDEMPPGRQEIRTRWLQSSERERAYNFLRRQTGEGRQAYIVYPLVEESDVIDAKAVVDEYEHIQQEVFPDRRVGLIHGRLRSDEKDSVMRAFAQGELDILLATSVIEVGVDVPNTTVIMIEGAERFGLAQLHQFRGRVGRGEFQSYCILMADQVTDVAEKRLSALEATNDGFILAERDLEIRGPGEFFGRRQSGLPELSQASLLYDVKVMEMAQREAAAMFAEDPELAFPEHELLRERVAAFWEQAGDVS